MKKVLLIGMSGLLILSSCGTATGTGAYVGGQFGHVIGSAIGAISGGRHGHDVGALIGTVGGVAAGAAIGAAVDNAEQRKYQEEVANRRRMNPPTRDESGFDAYGRGDDRIDFDGDGSTPGYNIASSQTVVPQTVSASSLGGYSLHVNPQIEIRHARVADANEDMVLVRNEECTVSFEIINHSDKPLFNVQPTVMEVTGNKHIHISPNLNIERIPPRQGVRYSATILADGRLKDGEVVIRIAVAQNNREITSQIQELTVPTRKKAK